MAKVPSKAHAPTQARLDHQFKDWKTRPYIHPPEFDAEYQRLMRLQSDQKAASGYARNGREFHDDWKSQ